MTNSSILKFSGAFHWVKTSRIRFWAFSYSRGDPCGRSFQLIMYFIAILHGSVSAARIVAGDSEANVRTCKPSASFRQTGLPQTVEDHLQRRLVPDREKPSQGRYRHSRRQRQELGKRGPRLRQAVKLNIGGNQAPIGRVPFRIEAGRTLGQLQSLGGATAEELGPSGNHQIHV